MTLEVYGATVVALMMLFYALESRSPWFSVAFGLACAGSSVYGWLAGTWPFGVVEGVWAVVAWVKAARRFRGESGTDGTGSPPAGQDPRRR
jgi:hypothetical protein